MNGSGSNQGAAGDFSPGVPTSVPFEGRPAPAQEPSAVDPSGGAATETGQRRRLSGAVALAALGVVFGDIGTSPLYVLTACFSTAHVGPTEANVAGIISTIVWTLVLVVCVKYVTFVMRVDHRGEGGILALLARLMPDRIKGVSPPMTVALVIAVVGGAALMGDGVITPAISVLSAVEGLHGISPGAQSWEVPITIAVLIGLFLVQSKGTHSVGAVFGPVMAVWFAVIALAGAVGIFHHPQILEALEPGRAIWFVTQHSIFGFLILGATILCVTGVEALYADMSHFGRIPITVAWYALVFPALLLNYLGQGGVLLADPSALDHPFYALLRGWTLAPAIVLATAATVIASQALISGAFTLIAQGIALNLVPRMRVEHTSSLYPGQVYVPSINALLAIGCILLVATFKNSDALASAYGLAVALTMAATTVLYYEVIRRKLHWNPLLAGGLFTLFIALDGSFVLAGLAKIPNGGWIPLVVAALLTFVATTWYDGRRRLSASIAKQATPVEEFLRTIGPAPAGKIDGTVVFLTADPTDIPYVVHSQWMRVQSLRERIVLLTLVPARQPYIAESERVTIERLDARLVRVKALFGFMELPNLAPIVNACAAHDLQIDDDTTSFVVASPQIWGVRGGMWAARRWLFDIMQRLAQSLPRDLAIPPNRLIELGVEVRI